MIVSEKAYLIPPQNILFCLPKKRFSQERFNQLHWNFAGRCMINQGKNN